MKKRNAQRASAEGRIGAVGDGRATAPIGSRMMTETAELSDQDLDTMAVAGGAVGPCNMPTRQRQT